MKYFKIKWRIYMAGRDLPSQLEEVEGVGGGRTDLSVV